MFKQISGNYGLEWVWQWVNILIKHLNTFRRETVSLMVPLWRAWLFSDYVYTHSGSEIVLSKSNVEESCKEPVNILLTAMTASVSEVFSADKKTATECV